MFNAMFMCIFWYCLLPKKKTPKAGNTPDESSINQEPLSEEAIKKERLQKRILTAWVCFYTPMDLSSLWAEIHQRCCSFIL